MRILFAADIHIAPGHLAKLLHTTLALNVDVLVIGGDIVPHYLPQAHAMGMLVAHAIYLEETLIPALKELKARKSVKIFLDFGNDDFMANRQLLVSYQGELFHLLHMQKHPLTRQVDILGYMMVPPTPFQRKDWEKPDAESAPHPPAGRVRLNGYITARGFIQKYTLDLDDHRTIEADLARMSELVERPFIFIAHCPPYDTPLDMLANGIHAGSVSVRRFVEHWSRQKMLVASLHGHIHESAHVSGTVCTQINGALIVNPGQESKLQYALLELNEQGGRPSISLCGP